VTRRLFLALWPDAETRATIAAATAGAARRCGARAVPAHNYHLTLAFLGAQPPEAVARLAATLTFPGLPFDLVLDRFGHWPGPRVWWLGPGTCPAGLRALVAETRRTLDGLAIGYDPRPFAPHLTLARKVVRPPDVPPPAPVRWPVAKFVLAESVSAPEGVRYDLLARFSAGSRPEP